MIKNSIKIIIRELVTASYDQIKDRVGKPCANELISLVDAGEVVRDSNKSYTLKGE